jgi:hypothetical protein
MLIQNQNYCTIFSRGFLIPNLIKICPILWDRRGKTNSCFSTFIFEKHLKMAANVRIKFFSSCFTWVRVFSSFSSVHIVMYLYTFQCPNGLKKSRVFTIIFKMMYILCSDSWRQDRWWMTSVLSSERAPQDEYNRSDQTLCQWFSTLVRPRPGKFFFYKTRAQPQQIYL